MSRIERFKEQSGKFPVKIESDTFVGTDSRRESIQNFILILLRMFIIYNNDKSNHLIFLCFH